MNTTPPYLLMNFVNTIKKPNDVEPSLTMFMFAINGETINILIMLNWAIGRAENTSGLDEKTGVKLKRNT